MPTYRLSGIYDPRSSPTGQMPQHQQQPQDAARLVAYGMPPGTLPTGPCYATNLASSALTPVYVGIPQTQPTGTFITSPTFTTVIQPQQQQQPPQPPRHSPTDNPLINSTDMIKVWHNEFNSLFGYFMQHWGHPWYLQGVLYNAPECDPSPIDYHDSAKARFQCQMCGNAWTSMKGRIKFWLQPYALPSGQICGGKLYFKLYGQKCQKCTPEEFQHAMWYPEEAKKVLTNAFFWIGERYYCFEKQQQIVTRRRGRPRTQHNSALCQACHEGVCREAARVDRESAGDVSGSP